MKNKILTVAAGLVGVATFGGVVTALTVTSPELIARFSSASGILALGSVGLFFVGLAYPKN